MYTFKGTKGENVVISLDGVPPESHTKERATLILTGILKIDRGFLPNNITAVLPATGDYFIVVAEQFKSKWSKGYKGKYCLTLKSSGEAWQSFRPFQPSGWSKYPITWVPDKIEQTIEVGQTIETTVSFVSRTSLKNAYLWVVPELQPFVSIEPSHFDTIEPNIPYQANIRFSASQNAQPGTYDGTIHLRVGKKTYPQTLKVKVNVVSTRNIPPLANAGPDQVIALPEGQITMDVQLDGIASHDPDGTITSYTWTGTPDPEDVVSPMVNLKQGIYEFTLQVTDDKGITSDLDKTKITILGPPFLIPLPEVTGESTATIKGVSIPGATILITNNSTGESKEVINENGLFEITFDLVTGINEFQAIANLSGLQSAGSKLKVTYSQNRNLHLESISPSSGQSGSIITLTGSGFTPDKNIMGVYFKGHEIEGIRAFEGKGIVLEASETMLKVVVPFVFLKSNEDLEVYIYDEDDMSNPLTFHVEPAIDPTPETKGNEADYQLDLIITQLQRVFNKLEQLTKPKVYPETWSLLEENIRRMQGFVETLKNRVDSIPDEDIKGNLDAVFGSEFFVILNQKLEAVNEILNHSSTGEAVCNINAVIATLNEIFEPIRIIHDILDTTEDILYGTLIGNSIACFFGCVPCCFAIPVISEAISVISAIDGVVSGIISVVDTVIDFMEAAVPTLPSLWKIDVKGPIPGIDNNIFYTATTSTLGVYANFTNAGFEHLLNEHTDLSIDIPDPFGVFSIISLVTGEDIQSMIEEALGSLIIELAIDLLDIDEIHITFADVLVPSTVRNTSPPNLLTIVNEGAISETHTLIAGSSTGCDELDIQASCGNYQYPLRTRCEQFVGDICILWGTDYPRYFPLEVIDVPIIENWHWETNTGSSYYDLIVKGKGFSAFSGVTEVYWNDLKVWNIGDLGTDSFKIYCAVWGCKPGWLKVEVVDRDGNKRETSSVYFSKSPDLEHNAAFRNPSLYPNDTLYVCGNYFTPYPSDQTLSLYYDGSLQAKINPEQIWYKDYTTIYDILAFSVPELLLFDAKEFSTNLQVGVGPYLSTQGTLNMLPFESAGSTSADDQDLMAFSGRNSYIRTAVVGDLNGDGINDLIIGVPSWGRDSGYPVGAVYIKFGPVEGLASSYGESIRSMIDLNSNLDVRILGDIRDIDSGGNSRRIGKSLAIGDLNGDGINDLIIGTSDRDDNDQHRVDIDLGYTSHPAHLPGKAYVIYGSQQWQQQYLLYLDQYDVKFYGDNQRELGFQVGAGHIYGQNHQDLVITAPADSLNQITARAYLIQGWDGSLPKKEILLPDDLNLFSHYAVIEGKNYYQYDFITNTQYIGDGLGKSLAIGNINGDGLDDIALGAPQYSQPWTHNPPTDLQGAAYIFYGKSAEQNPLQGYYFVDAKTNNTGDYTAVWGVQTRYVNEINKFGSSVAITDLNQDGKGEVIIGAPSALLEMEIWCSLLLVEDLQSNASIQETDIGRIYIFDGNNQSLFQSVTTADYGADAVVNGSKSISKFGYSLGSGDINNDGIKDLLVGSPGKSDKRGNVWILYGSESPFWRNTSGQDLVQLESRVKYNGYSGHFRDINYSFTSLSNLEDGFDYLLIGPEPDHVIDRPKFGAFVTTGDLNPYVGDDILVTDPIADYQNAPFSGLLYIFHEGSTEYWPLTIHPETVNMYFCNSEQIFSVSGGLKPYQFSWRSCYIGEIGPPYPMTCNEYLPDNFEAVYGEDSVLLRVNGCIPNNYMLSLKVTDSCNESVFRAINFLKPDISISPAGIDFGYVEVGWTINREITITNSGDSELQISSVSITWSADIRYNSNCPQSLAPQASCIIEAIFNPTIEGPATATLTITSNDPDEVTVNINLAGNGIGEPDIKSIVFGNLAFQDIPIGSSQSVRINIWNEGSVHLNISNVSISGAPEFSITENTCSGDLAPGPPYSPVQGSCYLIVTFTPTGTDIVSAIITVESNDPDTPTLTWDFSGNGIATFISVIPTSVDFAEAKKRIQLTIQNKSSESGLEWYINTDLPPWMTTSQQGGGMSPEETAIIFLYADRSGLDADQTYTHTLSITSNGGNVTVPVSMTVPIPLATFAKYYGGDGGEYFSKIRQTSDGGFIAVGLTNSFGMAEDAWVVKLDSSGYVEWERTYGGYWYPERAYDIRETSDGGYIMVAGTSTFTSEHSYGLWILKLNSYGDIEWEKEYEGNVDDNWGEWGMEFSIQQTSDGGYIVAGNSGVNDADNRSDIWVLKLDSDGDVQWQKTYGNFYNGHSREDYANSVQQTSDWGYIVAGVSRNVYGENNADLWILKLDSSGDIDWQKTYGGADSDYAYEIQQTLDGGFVVIGTTFSFGGAWVLKLDSSGDIQWQKTYGGWDGYGYSIKQTADGGYIFTGSFYRSGRGDDTWVVKLDSSGDIEWQKTYGGNRIDVTYSIEQTSEGDYIVAGYTNSFRTKPSGGPNYDAFVMKIDSIGNIGQSCGLVDLTAIIPVDTNIIPMDTSVIPQDSTTTPHDTVATVIDSSAVTDAICSETIPQAGQRPLIDIDVSPMSYDFGEVLIGDTASQVFTVRNLGYQPLQIISISLSGSSGSMDYTATHNCPVYPDDPLDIVQVCEITVSFTPSIEGSQGTYLSIESNDPDEGLIEIQITGSGWIRGGGGGEEGGGRW
ncbi:MAG: choice-of-anchor D domain-containing protein [Thermodesulfovibrionales bacterium]